MPERVVKNITRPYHEDLKMDRVFRHALKVGAAAYTVAMQTGLKDPYAVNHHLYHMVHDGTVSADITQTAIRDGVATANTHRTALRNAAPGQTISEPEFRNPVVKIKNTRWALNMHKGRYMAAANVGSRASPLQIRIWVPRSTVRRLEGHGRGELWITPSKYIVTRANMVEPVKRPVPSGRATISEALANVGRVPDTPKDIIGVDINAENTTFGNRSVMAQVDTSETLDGVVRAKTRTMHDTTYDRTHDDILYEQKTGRKISHDTEDARREGRRLICGGEKAYKRLQRRYRRLKKTGKKGEAAEVQKMMDRCVRDTERTHSRRRDHSKVREAAKASRRHDQALHLVALLIVSVAYQTGALLALEDLGGMPKGWLKHEKGFGRGLRRKLYSASMLKLSGMIWYKARFLGVECVRIYPHNTSKLCAECRGRLTGRYHDKRCCHCNVGVERDVNAVENVRRKTAAARYGPQVRAGLGEARRSADAIIVPAELTHGRWSGRADRLVAGPV